MRLVFMGTAEFAVPSLEALASSAHSLAAVITQPDRRGGRGNHLQSSPVKLAAESIGLELSQPESLSEQAFGGYVRTHQPDACVVVAYGKRIPPWLIAAPPHGVVNLHGSLLPKYRGAAPVNRAIEHGESETGVCTMQIDEGLDTGPVYSCRKVEIGSDETAPQLSLRLSRLGAALLVETVSAIEAGQARAVAQIHEDATAAPRLRREDGYITWKESAAEVRNKVRAFLPWPAVVVRFRGMRCRLLEARVADPAPEHMRAGEITSPRGRLMVRCAGSRLLEILRLQLENRKASSGSEFVNGFQPKPGERFVSLAELG